MQYRFVGRIGAWLWLYSARLKRFSSSALQTAASGVSRRMHGMS